MKDDRQAHERLAQVLDEQGTRLYAALARLTLRHDVAADLLQELFLRLGRSETFLTADNPAAFAWRTALNLAAEWRRRQSTSHRAPMPAEERIVAVDPSPLDRLLQDEQIGQLLDALQDLSELARQCFVLRLIERQSYTEIAKTLGKTPHQVRGHCHAAIKQLRQKLGVEV